MTSANGISISRLMPGDMIKTAREGMLLVMREIAPDEGTGASLECESILDGKRVDICALLSDVEVIRIVGGSR